MPIYQIYDEKEPLNSYVDMFPGILQALPIVDKMFQIKAIKGDLTGARPSIACVCANTNIVIREYSEVDE